MRRQRKALLVLPLIVFCFSTLFFWALGGGRGKAKDIRGEQSKGLNTKLPDARLKDQTRLNKMSFYDRAQADSQKIAQQRRSDPYAQKGRNPLSSDPQSGASAFSPHQPPLTSFGGNTDQNNEATLNATRINQRLAQLQSVVNKPPVINTAAPEKQASTRPETTAVTRPPQSEDPELTQMNGLLEKILDIQHPERVKSRTEPAAPVAELKRFKAIPAVIDGNQKITQGTVIRLKLTDSVTLGSQHFEKGQLLYGSGNLSSQRYTLNIKSIHIGTILYPVDLTVFDQVDGLEGICVPEAVTGDALREGASNGVQAMELMSLDPSMSAQLAGASINAAKGLFSKKVRRVKGKLRNGHPVLLRINSKN
jgi:hypothetical protein